ADDAAAETARQSLSQQARADPPGPAYRLARRHRAGRGGGHRPRPRRVAPSIQLDSRGIGNALPLLEFRGDERAELLRRLDARLGAELLQALLQRLGLEPVVD